VERKWPSISLSFQLFVSVSNIKARNVLSLCRSDVSCPSVNSLGKEFPAFKCVFACVSVRFANNSEMIVTKHENAISARGVTRINTRATNVMLSVN